MLIIRLVMVHMGPKHTQYGQKTARLAPVLQNGLNVHVGALNGPYAASETMPEAQFKSFCESQGVDYEEEDPGPVLRCIAAVRSTSAASHVARRS